MSKSSLNNIGIFGLGYVGLTTAACLLSRGYHVTGFDVSEEKLAKLGSGQIPITEPGVSEILKSALSLGTFRFEREPTARTLPGVNIVCVGTPSLPDGSGDLQSLWNVLKTLDNLAAGNATPFEIVIRSTMPPGTMQTIMRDFPSLSESDRICVYPEFLREGTAMADFFEPPQTILGVPADQAPPPNLLGMLKGFGFEVKVVAAGVAEMVKASSNAFHALKVTFANEIARIACARGIDGVQVMKLLVQDKKLNISSAYLMPGTPYGGSCLPKDTRMLDAQGRILGLGTELFAACEKSNRAHVDFVASKLLRMSPRRVAILGLAFKNDTDDLRESPSLTLLEVLALRPGIEIWIHDASAKPEQLLGINRRVFQLQGYNPNLHFSNDLHAVLQDVDAIVVMQKTKDYRVALEKTHVPVFDWANWQMPVTTD